MIQFYISHIFVVVIQNDVNTLVVSRKKYVTLMVANSIKIYKL
jgi:hypothetical protein